MSNPFALGGAGLPGGAPPAGGYRPPPAAGGERAGGAGGEVLVDSLAGLGTPDLLADPVPAAPGEIEAGAGEGGAPPAPAPGPAPLDAGDQKSRDLRDLEAQLKEKERALEERERELKEREAMEEKERRMLLPGGKRKNFPPCYPLVYHDLKEDIPEANQGMMRAAFGAWLMTEAGYVLNFSVMFLLLVTGNSAFTRFLICCMATGAGVPLSWSMWYQQIYAASQTNAATIPYMKFFLNFAFHILFCGLAFLAPPVIGSFNAGLFTAIGQFASGSGLNIFFGVLCLVNTALWGANTALSLYVMRWAYYTFRVTGGVQAAQQQAEIFEAGAKFFMSGGRGAGAGSYGATATSG